MFLGQSMSLAQFQVTKKYDKHRNYQGKYVQDGNKTKEYNRVGNYQGYYRQDGNTVKHYAKNGNLIESYKK